MDSANPLFMEEILQEIVALLPIGDRKNAALVNKFWRRLCNKKKFTKNETFFISNLYDYETVGSILYGCEKEIINLRFDQSLIDEESLHLWRTCGDRIDSLAFSKCIFQYGIIPQIFQQCPNLNEFSLQKGQFLEANNRTFHKPIEDNPFIRSNSLPSVASILLPAANTEHKKLTTLDLDSNILHLQSSDLHRLASAFPGLRRLQMKMLLNDDFRPRRITDGSPNLSILFELLATSQLDVSNLDVEFSTTLSAGCVITLNFDLWKPSTNLRSKSDQVERTAVPQLEPYFTFSESLTPIPFTKFCTSFTICTKGISHLTEIVEELKFTQLILNNPQLEKFSMRVPTLIIPQTAGLLLSAFIYSRLKYICLEVKEIMLDSCPFIEQVESYMQFYNLPINMSVQRLKIQTNSYEFNAICVRYFGNVQHLTVKPIVADDVFKLHQKNLKKFSIGVMDLPFSPPSTVVTVESLEVLKVRGSILGFLGAYQFPNLKYLIFTFYSKEFDYNYDRETNKEPVEEDLRTLLPLFGLNSSEFSGKESTSSSRRRRRKARAISAHKLFLLKLDRISSILAAKAPNLEGICVSGKYGYDLKPEDYALFFKLCQNFPKLRYASVRSTDEVEEEDIKAEMLKYMSECPSLRAFWFESSNCRTALYFDMIKKKLEFSDHYSKRNTDVSFGGINLKKFYSHNR